MAGRPRHVRCAGGGVVMSQHLVMTPAYDALIYDLLGSSTGHKRLDAMVWCAIHGHRFISLEGMWIGYERAADGARTDAPTQGLMNYTSDEAVAFSAMPADVLVTVWRRPEFGLLHNQRRAECKLTSAADPTGLYSVKGANTVPLAMMAALLDYRRRQHRMRGGQ